MSLAMAAGRKRQIAPEIPDELSYRSVEHRVLRACKTIRAVPDREHRFLAGFMGMHSTWKQVIREFMDAYASADVKVRFRPSPFEVSDCLPALEWCNVLNKNEFRMIWWRSFDNISFGVIAGRIGRSDETARRRYDDAIRKVWWQAITAWTTRTKQRSHPARIAC
jgi:hypothetical protein